MSLEGVLVWVLLGWIAYSIIKHSIKSLRNTNWREWAARQRESVWLMDWSWSFWIAGLACAGWYFFFDGSENLVWAMFALMAIGWVVENIQHKLWLRRFLKKAKQESEQLRT